MNCEIFRFDLLVPGMRSGPAGAFGKNAVWYDVAKGGTFFPFDGATGQFGLARALAAGLLCLALY